MTTTPTIPTALFNILAHPITESTASPNIFPTTGIRLDTAAFAVFAVTPSTLLVSVPSIDKTPTNNVSAIPKAHITLDLKNFDIWEIWNLSDIFETMPNAVDTSVIGKSMFTIAFPIKVIKNNKIGCIKLAETMLPSCNHKGN